MGWTSNSIVSAIHRCIATPPSSPYATLAIDACPRSHRGHVLLLGCPEPAIQGVSSTAAVDVAIWVPWYQQRKIAEADKAKQAGDITAIRVALRHEISTVAFECRREALGWLDALSFEITIRRDLSQFPTLTIHERNAHKIGLLTPAEIAPLIKFSSVLHHICGVVVVLSDVRTEPDRRQKFIQRRENKNQIVALLGAACEKAADFPDAIPGNPNAAKDRVFATDLRSVRDQVATGVAKAIEEEKRRDEQSPIRFL